MPTFDDARDRGAEGTDQLAARRHRKLSRRLAATFSAQQRIAEQIEVAHEFAAGVMLQQPSLVRQTLARSWALRARVLRMSLEATRYMSRDAVEQTRAEVAAAVDRLVAEIVASLQSWARTDQDARALRRDLDALAAPHPAVARPRADVSDVVVVQPQTVTNPPPVRTPRPERAVSHPTPGPRRVTAEDVLLR